MALKLVRYGVPLVILVAGIVFLVGGDTAFGIVLIGIAVLVELADLFARISISSQDDRDAEEAARERYSRTGRWGPPGGRPKPH